MTSPAAQPADPRDTDESFLDEAVELAVRSVRDGGGPFGAVLVEDGQVVARAVNRVTRDLDPSAHAEVLAIRAACQARGDFQLRGMTLYSSCEPCPMCLATALWARVDRVLNAADRHDAATGGFDDLAFYDMFASPREQWETSVTQVRTLTAHPAAPFEAWRHSTSRIDY